MVKKLSVLLFLFLFSFFLFAEENDTVSIQEERTRVIKYGIDSQLLDLITQINSENDNSYNTLLLDILKQTRNTKIQQAIVSLFIKTEEKAAFDWAKKKLMVVVEDDVYNSEEIINIIGYLGELKDNESADLFFKMLLKKDEDLNNALLRNLRKLETEHDAGYLLEMLEEQDYEDEKNTLVPELILTLGSLKYTPSAPMIEEILENDTATALNRNYSCIALGQIGQESSFSILESIYFESEDSILRSYALSGLGYYEKSEVLPILIEALRRDSYWKVREAAANSLKELKKPEAVDLLLYKAENDPVKQVQKAAFNALSEYGNSNSDFFISYLQDEKKPGDMRLYVLDILLEKKIPGTVEALDKIFDNYWNKKSNRFLEFCALRLSTAEWRELSPLYKRLLNHTYYINQLYGIRGIRLNNLSSLYNDVQALDKEGQNNFVRKEAKSFNKKEDSEESSSD